MKTYLMRIPEILKGISNTLDITATLCNKSWIVFNDDGVRLLFIFENDGTLIVSKNGIVSKQKWSYIKANSTLLIEDNQQAFLLHPVFIDNVVFALQQDGTEHHLFMIDETNSDRISMLSISSLCQYFEREESKRKELKTRQAADIAEEHRQQQEANKAIQNTNNRSIPLKENRARKIMEYIWTFMFIVFGIGNIIGMFTDSEIAYGIGVVGFVIAVIVLIIWWNMDE